MVRSKEAGGSWIPNGPEQLAKLAKNRPSRQSV